MDSPFAYVLLCQNQSVFLSRSVSIWGDAKEVPFIPQDSLKVRKYAGMTHPHSHSSFPLISLLENRDTDQGPQTHRVTGRSYEERKQQGWHSFLVCAPAATMVGFFRKKKQELFQRSILLSYKSWHQTFPCDLQFVCVLHCKNELQHLTKLRG